VVPPPSDPPSEVELDTNGPAETAEPLEADATLAAAQDNIDAVVRRFLSLPPITITAVPPADDGVDRSATTIPPSKPPSIEELQGFDAKLTELEPHLAETNWEQVLAALEKHESLPPQLALLYAIAQRERNAPGDADSVAIRAVAALLGVSVESHAALVVAKRLLRRNPIAWQKRKAPPAKISVLIAVIVMLVGAAAGYVLSPNVPLFQ